MSNQLYDIGMVGLGAMGRNLALNMADHGYAVAGYDKDPSKGQILRVEGAARPIEAADTPSTLVQMVRPPRSIFLLVAPAPAVDVVLQTLTPLLQPDDLIVDAGNSYYQDTDRRGAELAAKGIRFFGMGISGGEAGARQGPSLMPGGPREAYERVRPLLEAIAARIDKEACVGYLGPGSAGHYVKMVHNGIEYGLMQLIAETYDLLKRGLNFNNDDLHAVYERWNRGPLNSYLLEITAQIFLKRSDKPGKRLLDLVRDMSGHKGTGQWTAQEALDLHVPVPTIDVAVAMRDLSGYESERAAAFQFHQGPLVAYKGDRDGFVKQLHNALDAATIIAYAQGMDLLRHGSREREYHLNLEEVARIWRGGCIIRSALLDEIRAAFNFRPDLPNLLVDPRIAERLQTRQGGLRAVVRLAADWGIPVPGLMMSLAYFDSWRSGWLPANLIQAQRDFFGAHPYERIDEEGIFHSRWDQP